LASKLKFSKLKTAARITIAGELEHKNSKLETSSPGPCRYENHKQKLAMLSKTIGNYKQLEERKDVQSHVKKLSL
jgi:hypothetical protein